MGHSSKRIALPTGGWWEITTRPLWKHVRQWRASSQGGDSNADLIERVLVSLTTAWSFPEEVNLEALALRQVEDLVAIHRGFLREVAPLLERKSPKKMAQELFAGLLAGEIPDQFVEVHLMAATGWSWQELQETPADVVDRMAIYLAVKRARETKGSLDYVDAEEEPDGQ